MNKLWLLAVSLISIGQSAFGVLPPLYQGAAEIKAILSSEKLGDYLDAGQIIQNINKIDLGYSVSTQEYNLTVEIRYLPSKGPGPARFELIFHDAVPMNRYQDRFSLNNKSPIKN